MTSKTGPNLVNKLGVKAMGVQPKRNSFVQTVGEGDKAHEEILPERKLALIYGKANKYDVGESNFGEFTKFKGSFEGVNLATGEVYRSSNCFLPDVVTGMIVEALDNADGNAVEFALEIGAKHSSSATGYEYTVKPLTEPAESDELSGMRLLAREQLALAAPETEKNEDKGATKKVAAKK